MRSTAAHNFGTRPVWFALLVALVVAHVQGQTVHAPNSAVFTNYHGWSNSVSINNGVVEAVVVPTDGRVQQFRFLGDTNGVLWENSALWGKVPFRFLSEFRGRQGLAITAIRLGLAASKRV